MLIRSGCWVGAIFFVGLCLIGGRATAQSDAVQFGRDVAPILKQHCLDCHGEKAEGDLRLDRAEGFAAGGHSGNSILGSTPADSELLLRVVSESDGYRMPKTGPRLSDPEIETLRKWIEQGAKWDSVEGESPVDDSLQKSNPRETGTNQPLSLIERLASWWSASAEAVKRPSWKYLLGSIVFFLTAFIGIYLVRNFETKASREARKQSRGDDRVKAPANWIGRGFRILFAGLVCYTAFLFGRVQELESGSLEARQNVFDSQTKKTLPELIVSYDNLVEPPYPMHPRRLGGTYYRGNDERSKELFNGGFYRTATLDLFLVDETGSRLQPGDPIPSNASIELTIKLAPNATEELFSERVWSTTYLKHFPVSIQGNRSQEKKSPERLNFDILEPNRCWQKRVPIWDATSDLGRNDLADSETLTGMIYLYYGAQDFGAQIGRVHFGIKYSIEISKGVLSNESELWMGSIYNLNGRVLVPEKGQILLDRWFDFRPIPVIEGVPSDDPELLGLPEHQQNR